jgi:hypothetical protein
MQGDPENVARRQHQAEFAPQAEHPRAEPDGQLTFSLLGVGDARPRHVCPSGLAAAGAQWSVSGSHRPDQNLAVEQEPSADPMLQVHQRADLSARRRG